MKSISVLLLVSIFNMPATQCNKSEKNIPACVSKKIDEIKAQPKWNPAAEVNEYVYNDKTVFLFTSDCCDQYSMLYDDECNFICAPSGGITGKGDGKCTGFYDAAKFVKLVWKDSR